MSRQIQPQPVLTPLTSSAVFLVATVNAGGEDTVRNLLADLPGLSRAVGFRDLTGGLACVAGIGAQLWGRLYEGPRPLGLHPFRELVGPRHVAVSTPGDLMFHIRARSMDLCFELASLLVDRLAGQVMVVDEVQGFRYFDQRDLLGFVDGTENPTGPGADAAVMIGAEDPAFTGGSYVVVQKYLHDLATWNGLSTEEQERVIGRHKLNDVELAEDVKPPDSHVALNTITDENGAQLQIVRDNMPFGTIGAGEFGTHFIGYASTPDVIEQMLVNMFLGRPEGNTDRILDFSTAVTGCLFFVPSVDFLTDQPAGPEAAAAEPATESATIDDSLHIGSLKRSLAP